MKRKRKILRYSRLRTVLCTGTVMKDENFTCIFREQTDYATKIFNFMAKI